MPLSKLFTAKMIEDQVRIATKQISPEKIQSLSIIDIINKNLLDLVEMLNGQSMPDYMVAQVVTDAASNTATSMLAVSFTHLTKTINKVAHGLTSASIGKRILLGQIAFDPAELLNPTLGTIVSITDVNNFVVSCTPGKNLPDGGNNFWYAIFPSHTSSFIDLSGLKINKIDRLEDSLNGPVVEEKNFHFSSLGKYTQFSKGVFYNTVGESLMLFKGSAVAAWGVLTLYYYRTVQFVTSETDFIDLKDQFMPLLIDKCTLDVFSFAQIEAPSSITQNVENRTKDIRIALGEREAKIKSNQK